MKKFRIISVLCLLLVSQKFYAQNVIAKKPLSNPLYVNHSSFGFSDIGGFATVFSLIDTVFTYTKEQTSTWEPLISKNNRIDTISSGYFRRTSIDSIIKVISKFKDTTIFKSNPCIMGGGIDFLTIAIGTDTVKYKLKNTMDYDALKIINILNLYLPEDEKIYASEEDIKEEIECWASLRKEWSNEKKDTHKKKRKK